MTNHSHSVETPRSTDALREQVLSAQAILKAADEACYAAKQAAERARDQACAASNKLLSSLEARYGDLAQDLAIEAQACPRSHWGQYLTPDDLTVCPQGIHLSWDIYDNYAPAHFLATWEDLRAAEAAAAQEGVAQ